MDHNNRRQNADRNILDRTQVFCEGLLVRTGSASSTRPHRHEEVKMWGHERAHDMECHGRWHTRFNEYSSHMALPFSIYRGVRSTIIEMAENKADLVKSRRMTYSNGWLHAELQDTVIRCRGTEDALAMQIRRTNDARWSSTIRCVEFNEEPERRVDSLSQNTNTEATGQSGVENDCRVSPNRNNAPATPIGRDVHGLDDPDGDIFPDVGEVEHEFGEFEPPDDVADQYPQEEPANVEAPGTSQASGLVTRKVATEMKKAARIEHSQNMKRFKASAERAKEAFSRGCKALATENVPRRTVVVPLKVDKSHTAYFCGGYVYCTKCGHFGSGSTSTAKLRAQCVPRVRISPQVKKLMEGYNPYGSSNRPGPLWPDTSPARTVLPVFRLTDEDWDASRDRHVITIPENMDAFGICIHQEEGNGVRCPPAQEEGDGQADMKNTNST